jgi:tyrosine-protein kinase Etk/Wzc
MMESGTGTAPAAVRSETNDGISVMHLLVAVGQEKKVILSCALGGLLTGVVIALASPSAYTARTTLLPPAQNSSALAGMAASVGALLGPGLPAFKAQEELVVGLLKTDSVADALIRRFNLHERYDDKTLQGTRRKLASNSRISADRRSTLITVEVEDTEPAMAAQLSNAYAEELRRLMTRIAVTEAQQRRAYFERQIEKSKTDLAQAELAIKQAQDKSGVISLDAQTQGTIGAAAQLRAQLMAREVQIQSMRAYSGPDNPEFRRLRSEVASLRDQLAKVEGGVSDTPPEARKGAAEALGSLRLFRELKYQEAMYSAMLQQLQLAKADEAREAPLVQQVDTAVPPDRRSRPHRTLLAGLCTFAGLMIGMMAAYVRRSRSDPLGTNAWDELAAAWSWKRAG